MISFYTKIYVVGIEDYKIVNLHGWFIFVENFKKNELYDNSYRFIGPPLIFYYTTYMLRNILNNAEVQDISTNTLQGVIPAEAFGVVSSEGKTMEKPSTVSLSHGAVSVIGRRRSMEDAVTVVPANDHDLDQHLNYDFFGVYDGNGVAYRVTQKCKERLHHVVAEQFAVLGAEQWENVMATSFARMDEEIARDECSIGVRGPTIVLDELVGSTALVVLVGSQEIVVANCGDSKAVLSCDGNVLTLSSDTKVWFYFFFSFLIC